MPPTRSKPRKSANNGDQEQSCPYLDTVDRSRLDFDFEKACCVTLSPNNVYSCLVCGKYYQGRGSSSPAYYHSMNEQHQIFINLSTLKIYCLPDNYQVHDPSLDDIKYAINPTFTPDQVSSLSSLQGEELSVEAYDLAGKRYIPGFIGLNNIKQNDYINVVIQALAHVPPLRDHLLLHSNTGSGELVKRFAVLVRKMWNGRAFRCHISPHELIQEISNSSGKLFVITSQSDAYTFMSWFLQMLATGDMGAVVQDLFQGEMEVQSCDVDDDKQEFHTARKHFMHLSLELPPMPLFLNNTDKNGGIAQVSLESLMRRYQGGEEHIVKNERRKYRIRTFPRYLILHMQRFGKNNFSVEKNVTIVNFPVGSSLDFVDIAGKEVSYTLLANVVHEGQAKSGEGSYRVHVKDTRVQSTDKWYQLRDLEVEEMIAEEMQLSEAYIQIWQKTI